MKRSMIEKGAAAAGVPSGSRVTGALRLSVAAAGVLLMCAASSCKKDEGVDAAPVYNVRTFHASSEVQAGDGKTTLQGSDVLWEVNDRAAVQGDDDTNYLEYSANTGGSSTTDYNCVGGDGASGNTFCAIYPYSAVSGNCNFTSSGGGSKEEYPTWGVKLPQCQTGKFAGTFASGANVMAAKSGSTALKFKNLCGVLRLKLSGSSEIRVKSILVASKNNDDKLWGDGTVTFHSGEGTDRHALGSLNGDNSVCIVYTEGMPLNDGENGVEFDLVLPDNTLAQGFRMTVNCEYDGRRGAYVTGTAISGGEAMIKVNQITEMPVVSIEKGDMKGEFSVSATDKVCFSTGNLWYDKSGSGGSYWGFEAHQYDFRTYPGKGSMLGGAYNTGSGTPADTYGLFGWGDAPADGGGINTSTTDSDYTWPNDGTDPWGSKIAEGWRTLTKDECAYLLNVDNAESGARDKSWKRFAKATVMGVPGLMVFPDGTTGTTIGGVEISNANVTDAAFTANTITDNSTWSSMEAAGVVFLPCAGYRNGTSVNNVGTYGCYWSSSPNGSSDAYVLDFDSGRVSPASTDLYRYNGRSVRLVCP